MKLVSGWAIALSVFLVSACGRTDIIVHVPPSDGAVVVDFETESGEITPRLTVVLDPVAFGGAYLFDDAPSGAAAPPDQSGTALYVFEIQRPGVRDYFIRGLAFAPTTDRDSFFLKVDDGQEIDYFTSGGDCYPDNTCVDHWQWVLVAEGGTYRTPWDPIPFPLGPGQHSLQLRAREGQSAVDRIQLLDGLD
ncbi:hypothetical protein ACFL6C_09075 [Myxococcota bacterium]